MQATGHRWGWKSHLAWGRASSKTPAASLAILTPTCNWGWPWGIWFLEDFWGRGRSTLLFACVLKSAFHHPLQRQSNKQSIFLISLSFPDAWIKVEGLFEINVTFSKLNVSVFCIYWGGMRELPKPTNSHGNEQSACLPSPQHHTSPTAPQLPLPHKPLLIPIPSPILNILSTIFIELKRGKHLPHNTTADRRQFYNI